LSDAVICTQGLLKKYGRLTAVDGLDLEVAGGEIFGFLGPNGAGKTTTCRILTTLTKPTAGKALVHGRDVVQDPVGAKGGMGLVPQHLNVDPDLTVYENLKLHGMLHGMSAGRREERITAMLEFAGLSDRRGRLAKGLSGGLKRRLMIARALLHEPRVLFLDEPTVGLDAHTRRRTWDLIRRSNRAGVTVFLTTHYIEEAENLCRRVGIIHQGRLIALDSPQNLLARTGRVVVEDVRGTDGEARFFESRSQAAAYAAGRREDLVIRSSNLEDVFISLTGRKVAGGEAEKDNSHGHAGH
jgi:ABC-2 type transport system ATP-binding protein